MLTSLADEVLGLLRAAAVRTEALARAAELACPALCGRCCLANEVESTVLEMLPAARELLRRGEAEAWLARLAAPGLPARCVLYSPLTADGTRGRCSLYERRPSVCRLFGFAARRDKHGRPELVACAVHREERPGETARAASLVAEGFPAAVFADEHVAIAAVHPTLGTELLPINVALARALEALALEERLRAEQGG
ncbi:MAG: YkgJ family cysteine cluster protein [Planctomycetota bacterium]